MHDLLHVARLNKRFYGIVTNCEAAWRAAYESYFESCLNPGEACTQAEKEEGARSSWREEFKCCYIKNAKAARLYIGARRAKARSQVHVLRQETFRLQQKVINERRLRDALDKQVHSIKSAWQQSSILVTKSYWLPRAVTIAAGSVVQQTHRNSREYEQELFQKLSVSKLEIVKLERMLRSRQAALVLAERKLAALEP